MSYDLGVLNLAGGRKKSKMKMYIAVAVVVIVIVVVVVALRATDRIDTLPTDPGSPTQGNAP